MTRTSPLLLLALLLAGAPVAKGQEALDPGPPKIPILAGDPETGARFFPKCKACHEVGPGARERIGPPLNGIVGGRIGAAEGYRYSAAMESLARTGRTWDVATLSSYLADPRRTVPGTSMSFAGLPTSQQIADVVSYLATFDRSGRAKRR